MIYGAISIDPSLSRKLKRDEDVLFQTCNKVRDVFTAAHIKSFTPSSEMNFSLPSNRLRSPITSILWPSRRLILDSLKRSAAPAWIINAQIEFPFDLFSSFSLFLISSSQNVVMELYHAIMMGQCTSIQCLLPHFHYSIQQVPCKSIQ